MELTLLGTLQKAVIRCHTQHEMDIGIRSSDRKIHSGVASALRGRKRYYHEAHAKARNILCWWGQRQVVHR